MIPDVDVIILSLNRQELTLQTIENIHTQRDVNKVIWVVDQGSSEECLEILRGESEHGRINLIELGRNYGVAGGRNRGFELGKARVIVSIDNDAVFESDLALANILVRFQEDSSLAALSFRIINYFTGEDDRHCWAFPRKLLKQRAKPFVTTRFLGGASALRRSALSQTRGYDEDLFFYWEELDLSYQLIQAGYRIFYEPSVRVLHKVSPEARVDWQSGRFYYLVRNALYIDFKYFDSIKRLILLTGGYLLKGFYNGLVRQAIKGIRDAVKMIHEVNREQIAPLDAEAREYISIHDWSYRGSIWQRALQEVFEHLPSSSIRRSIRDNDKYP